MQEIIIYSRKNSSVEFAAMNLDITKCYLYADLDSMKVVGCFSEFCSGSKSSRTWIWNSVLGEALNFCSKNGISTILVSNRKTISIYEENVSAIEKLAKERGIKFRFLDIEMLLPF